MTYRALLVTTPDGRTLEVATLGDPRGHTVFFHHGTPGSASLVSYFESAAAGTDLFVVTTSRPGYSRSTRLAGRRASSVVDDVRCALDALGRGEYVSVGWSGGGPHALACAALDAPRCVAAWSLAGVAPGDVDFDWTEGMGPENREEFALAREGGPRYEAYLAGVAEAMASATPDNVVDFFGQLLSDVDRTALDPMAVREVFATSCREAAVQGWHGMHDDDVVFQSPWGFDPAEITVPVEVWYGDHDLMVPARHGEWLAQRIPSATVVHRPDDGHITLMTQHMDELAAACRRAFGAGSSGAAAGRGA
ncbi:MAG: alpha/beta fold hydrolase [Acidimicrobiales bacterium]